MGAGLPIAAGAATAAQLRRDGSVAVAFFGDGAVAHGTFHEAVNLAAVWQLPVIFFCENNGYAEFSPASAQHAAPLERRAAGYGVDYVAVDGNDVVATATAMHDGGRGDSRRDAVPSSSRPPPTAGTVTTKATRSATDRPTRFAEWEARDPLLVHARRLRSAGIARRRARVHAVSRSRASSTTRSRRLGGWRRRRPPR